MSADSVRLAFKAKSTAVSPRLFFNVTSAPASRSNFTEDGVPNIAAIMSGVLPFGDAASMYAWLSSNSLMISICPPVAA
jgi:hypothetical protein